MPTVHLQGGFRFVIYPNDHRPPHVHVFKAGTEVVLGGRSVARARLTEEQIRVQLAVADVSQEPGPRALRARYDRRSGRIHVELSDGCLFAFPAELGEGLRGASPDELATVSITPTGLGLRWDKLDADLYVPALLQGHFGSTAWMSELGRQMGRARTPAKAAAARENGLKGGRPRKHGSESHGAGKSKAGNL